MSVPILEQILKGYIDKMRNGCDLTYVTPIYCRLLSNVNTLHQTVIQQFSRNVGYLTAIFRLIKQIRTHFLPFTLRWRMTPHAPTDLTLTGVKTGILLNSTRLDYTRLYKTRLYKTRLYKTRLANGSKQYSSDQYILIK